MEPSIVIKYDQNGKRRPLKSTRTLDRFLWQVTKVRVTSNLHLGEVQATFDCQGGTRFITVWPDMADLWDYLNRRVLKGTPILWGAREHTYVADPSKRGHYPWKTGA